MIVWMYIGANLHACYGATADSLELLPIMLCCCKCSTLCWSISALMYTQRHRGWGVGADLFMWYTSWINGQDVRLVWEPMVIIDHHSVLLFRVLGFLLCLLFDLLCCFHLNSLSCLYFGKMKEVSLFCVCTVGFLTNSCHCSHFVLKFVLNTITHTDTLFESEMKLDYIKVDDYNG